jgi:hypothetical protein
MCDGVPVDTCANLTLAAAWEAHRAHLAGETGVKVLLVGIYCNIVCRQVYNHISGNAMPQTWGEIYSRAKDCLMRWAGGRREGAPCGLARNPLEGMVWFPGGSFKQSHWINRVHELVLHDLPAQLTDLACR